jgi:hypothetical protein
VNGAYPENLEGLVAAGLLEPGQIKSGQGRIYTYMYLPAEGEYALSQ